MRMPLFLAFSLMATPAVSQEAPSQMRIEKKIIVHKDHAPSSMSDEMIAQCDGGKLIESAPVDESRTQPADGKMVRNKVVLCIKGDPGQALPKLKEARALIAESPDLLPETKADMLAKIDSEIARMTVALRNKPNS